MLDRGLRFRSDGLTEASKHLMEYAEGIQVVRSFDGTGAAERDYNKWVEIIREGFRKAITRNTPLATLANSLATIAVGIRLAYDLRQYMNRFAVLFQKTMLFRTRSKTISGSVTLRRVSTMLWTPQSRPRYMRQASRQSASSPHPKSEAVTLSPHYVKDTRRDLTRNTGQHIPTTLRQRRVNS